MSKLKVPFLILVTSFAVGACGGESEPSGRTSDAQSTTTAAATSAAIDPAFRKKCTETAAKVSDISKRSRQDPAALDEMASIDPAFLEECKQKLEAAEGKGKVEVRTP